MYVLYGITAAEGFLWFSPLQVLGRRALASCTRPLVSTGWRIDAYSLQQRPSAAVQVHMASIQCHAAHSAYCGDFFSSGNIFKMSFTIFRALSSPVPFPPKVRYASGRKGFLGEFVDNLRQEFNKNQEMKDNIKKFREEAKRLEESDALQQARRKYVRFSYFRVKFLCEPESNFSVWGDFSYTIFFDRNLLRQRRWRLQRFSRRLLALCPTLLGR